MPTVTEYKEEKSKLPPLAQWIRGEKSMGFNTLTEDEKAAEKARKETANAAYYKNLPAFKQINKSERQGVMDSYDSYFTNNYSALANIAQSRFLGYAFLSYIAQDAFIRRAVSTRADEMTRAWGELVGLDKDKTNEEKIDFITKEHERLEVKTAFRKVSTLTGFFGGCLVYIDVRYNENETLSDEELAKPLYIKGQNDFNKAKLKDMKLMGLRPIEPINIAPSTYNTSDPTAADFYEPEHFYILGKKIHKSRFLYFAENIPPQILKPVYLFFGIPLAQIMFPYVQAFYKSKDVVNNVVLKFSCTALATEIDALLVNDGQSAVEDRINTIAKYRDNNSIILLDKNTEDLTQINTPITGLKEILWANLEMMPIISGIPTTKFLETSPTGLNATGEFDMRNFYDLIATLQNNTFNDPINKLNDIICLCNGLEYTGLNWVWCPLYQMSDREKAEVNRMKAETSNVYVQMGAITNADVAKQLMNDKDSEYESIEIPEPIDITEQEEEANVGENGADSEIDKIIKDEEMSDAEFEESKHPRNSDGTFKGSGTNTNSSKKEYFSNPKKAIGTAEIEGKTLKVYYQADKSEFLDKLSKTGSTEIKPIEERKDASELLKPLAGKDLLNEETKLTAQVNTDQRNKLVSQKSIDKSIANGFTEEEHLGAAAQIDKLYKNAILRFEREDEKEDPNVLSIRRFVAPITIKGKPAYAKLTLKESFNNDKTHKKIYTVELHSLEQVEKGNAALDSLI